MLPSPSLGEIDDRTEKQIQAIADQLREMVRGKCHGGLNVPMQAGVIGKVEQKKTLNL